MSENQNSIIRLPSSEILVERPLVRQLLDFAEQVGFDPFTSHGVYLDKGHSARFEPIPNNLKSLVAEHPQNYGIVYLDKRLGNYYQAGTRFEEVGLSTVKNRKETDEKIYELAYGFEEGLQDPYLRVGQFVGQKDFEQINEWDHAQNTRHGSGSAVKTYRIQPNGKQRLIELSTDRLDENRTSWQNSEELGRLTRKLDVAIQQDGSSDINFEEAYMIGWQQKGGFNQSARVRAELNGQHGEINTIKLIIGPWGPGQPQVLFKDESNHIEILYDNPRELDLLKYESSYAPLFNNVVDRDTIITMLKMKIQTLAEDWDKPQTVFTSEAPQLDVRKSELPRGNEEP